MWVRIRFENRGLSDARSNVRIATTLVLLFSYMMLRKIIVEKAQFKLLAPAQGGVYYG
jgi:hypothetical protein